MDLTGHTRALANRFALENGKTLVDVDWVAAQSLKHETSASIIAFVQAARRYIIARDFGEFDTKKADILWKLKYGGAL